MANGSGPPIFKNVDYQVIKSGICITSGPYEGCIKVGSKHYWVYPDNYDTYWIMKSGTPNPSFQTKITDDVWDYCKDGGTYDWDAHNEWWEDARHNEYRWDGDRGGTVSLVQI